MQVTRHCLALDLKDDPQLITEYEEYHKNVWPEILDSIKQSGIEKLEMYRYHNRLFMIMEVNSTFNFENKRMIDESSEIVQQWEELMWKYQQSMPLSKPGEKWMLMNKIFSL